MSTSTVSSKIKSITTKHELYRFLKTPIHQNGNIGDAQYSPFIQGGEMFSMLEHNSFGIPLGFMACANDTEALSFRLNAAPNLNLMSFHDLRDPDASLASQQLWHSNNKAKMDSDARIQKINGYMYATLLDFRQACKDNSFINDHIGSLNIEQMSLYQIIYYLLRCRVLVITNNDKIAIKNAMSKEFQLDVHSTTKATLQLELFFGEIANYTDFASSNDHDYRSEEILEFLRLNFCNSKHGVSNFYFQQKQRNGLSTAADIITSMHNGMANFDDDLSWKSQKNIFAFNAIKEAIQDSDSDDSTVLHPAANAAIISAADKKKKKKKTIKIKTSTLPVDHPETFCNFSSHFQNGKPVTHSNQACAARMLIKLRNAHYTKHGKVDEHAEAALTIEAKELTAFGKFPAPR